MKIKIHNVGKLADATVEIDGITVIAGENDTGKSSVSKALYSVFSSFYHFNKSIYSQRKLEIADLLNSLLGNQFRNGRIYRFDIRQTTLLDSLADEILVLSSGSDNHVDKQNLLSILNNHEELSDIEIEDEFIDKLNEIISVSEKEVLEAKVSRKFNAEFDRQVGNLDSDGAGSVELLFKNQASLKLSITSNKAKIVDDYFEIKKRILYFDDPFVINNLSNRLYKANQVGNDHNSDNVSLLKNSIIDTSSADIRQAIVNKKLEDLKSSISTICKGNLFENEFGDYVYKEEGSDKAYFLKNLSSGLKTFVLFNTFLQSGVIESGATIIFDEPEIHLHPKWQLEFAKMIVQLQKALNLNILINTHSPYFLYALEVFVKKYGTLESTRYYFAHIEDRCPVIEDVSSDIERIYKTLFSPLRLLENVRDSL